VCGISGLITRSPINDKEANQLLELFCDMETEGGDAAGFYNGEKIVKFPTTPTSILALHYNKLIDLDLYDEIIDRRIILNHNRAATQGHYTENKNNHPFETKNFIFSHNGVLTGEFCLKKYNADEEPETDSWLFLRALEEKYEKKKDLIESLKTTIKDITGSITFWLYDKNTDEIYFYNDNRRLYYYRDRGEFWFASLESYLKRNLNAKASGIFSFPLHKLYKFSIKDFQLRNVCSIPHSSATNIIYGKGYSYWPKKEAVQKYQRDTKIVKYPDNVTKKSKDKEDKKTVHVPNLGITLSPVLESIMTLHSLEITYMNDENVYVKFLPSYEATVRDLYWKFKDIHRFTVTKHVMILPKVDWDSALLDILLSLNEEFL